MLRDISFFNNINSLKMRRINIAFKDKTNPLEYCDYQLQPVDESFKVDVIKTYDYNEKQVRRTEFINNQLINGHLVDINRIVETFLIAALLLFSALEEADWLCFSANSRSEDIVEDESSFNIYKLLSFIRFDKNSAK